MKVLYKLGGRCASCCWSSNWNCVWLQVSILAVSASCGSLVIDSVCMCVLCLEAVFCDAFLKQLFGTTGADLLSQTWTLYFIKPCLVKKKKSPLTVFCFSIKFLWIWNQIDSLFVECECCHCDFWRALYVLRVLHTMIKKLLPLTKLPMAWICCTADMQIQNFTESVT